MSSRPAHVPLMLALTFSTGIIDAIGYLGLDRVFTGNMTGNVVVLGMGLAGSLGVGGNGLPVAGPLLALAGFLCGAALAGRSLRRAGAGWCPTTTWLLAAVAAAMVAIGVLLLVDDHPVRAVTLPVTGLLGLAMGTQAGTARQVGVRDVSTVVVTSTLAGLAAESWFGNGQGAQVARRGSAVVLILTGAGVGALLLQVHLGLGVLVSAAITAVVAVVGHRDARSSQGVQG